MNGPISNRWVALFLCLLCLSALIAFVLRGQRDRDETVAVDVGQELFSASASLEELIPNGIDAGQREGVQSGEQTQGTPEYEFVLTHDLFGTPLNDYLVRISDGSGWSVELATNSLGSATFLREGDSSFEAKIKFIDNKEMIGRRPEEMHAKFSSKSVEPLQLMVESGPQFFVAFDDLSVITDASKLHGTIARTEKVWQLVQESRTPENFPILDSPIRGDGGLDWVRFGLPGKFIAGSEATKLSLAVSDRSGTFLAHGEVDLEDILPSDTVVLRSMSVGTLLGTVKGPSGSLPDGVWVKMTGLDSDLFAATTQWVEDGIFSFLYLMPGDYQLDSSGPGLVKSEAVVHVVRGVNRISFELFSQASAGRVHGVVHSKSGMYKDQVYVELYPTEKGGMPIPRAPVNWRAKDGVRVGEFEFENVSFGNYRLSLDMQGLFHWSGSAGVLRLPGEEIFVSIDDSDLRDVLFVAVDAKTHQSINGSVALVLLRKGNATTVIHGEDSVLVENISLSGPWRWFVMREGFLPLRVNATDLLDASANYKELIEYTVELESGWGTYLLFVDEAGEPVSGVEVLVDETRYYADGSGELEIRLDEKPLKITISKSGWVVSQRSVDWFNKMVWPSLNRVVLRESS